MLTNMGSFVSHFRDDVGRRPTVAEFCEFGDTGFVYVDDESVGSLRMQDGFHAPCIQAVHPAVLDTPITANVCYEWSITDHTGPGAKLPNTVRDRKLPHEVPKADPLVGMRDDGHVGRYVGRVLCHLGLEFTPPLAIERPFR